ncbi:MaoC family dehydratase N-terminal domain-containing protein [Chloroflexota bacterium]
MAEQPLITEAIRKAIGVESEPVAFKVDKERIKSFARAIQDPNPLWNDERQARKTRYGGLIAPPIFLMSLRNERWIEDNLTLIDCPLKGVLMGGQEFEFYEPIRSGDTIYVSCKLVDALVKEGKSGKMVLLISDISYQNHFGDLVAKVRRTTIRTSPVSSP